MGLKRTKLLGIQAVTGINTVGILTVGTTPTAGGVGVASTTYLRGVVMHNTVGTELQEQVSTYIQKVLHQTDLMVLELVDYRALILTQMKLSSLN